MEKSSIGSGNLHGGLTNRNPKPPVDEVKPKGASVDSDATRSGTAATPKSLGPRTA